MFDRRVTSEFGIVGPVPFVDVQVDRDNLLFLDPSAIRVASQAGDVYAAKAHAQLVSFFTEIITCARSSSTADQSRGRALLQSMHEPNETRLGYSRARSQGHAFAEEMGSRLWDEIVRNRTLRSAIDGDLSMHTALLSRLERVPLFVDRVDRDMISDMTTRIVFNVLHEFTLEMIRLYPSIGREMAIHTYLTWETATKRLIESSLGMPTVDGVPLLLVPITWVYWRLVMDPDAFYNRYATRVIQEEQTIRDAKGLVMKPTKQQIKKQNKAVKATNAREAARCVEEYERDLAKEYEVEIDGLFKPLSGDELAQRLRRSGN